MYRDISKKKWCYFNRKDSRNQMTRRLILSNVYDSHTTSDQNDDDFVIKDNDASQDMYTNAQNRNETM